MCELQDRLPRSDARSLIIAHTQPFQRSWLTYFGRKQRIWLIEPSVIDIDFTRRPGGERLVSLDELPPDVLAVTEQGKLFSEVAPGEMDLLWSGQTLQLWRAASRRWALPVTIRNPNGVEQLDGRPFFWVGSEAAEVEVLAGCPGKLTLSADFLPGPSLPTTMTRRLEARTSHGHRAEVVIEPGAGTVTVPIGTGRTTVLLRGLDRSTRVLGPGDDPRPLLVGVHGLRAAFRPDPNTPGRGR
jgi:hypothetical protein